MRLINGLYKVARGTALLSQGAAYVASERKMTQSEREEYYEPGDFAEMTEFRFAEALREKGKEDVFRFFGKKREKQQKAS